MRFSLFLLLFGSISLQAQSQIDLSVKAGFQYSLGSQVGGDEIYESVQSSQKVKLRYGLGSGRKIALSGQYHLKDSSPFVLGLNLEYLIGNQERYAENSNDTLQYLSFTTLQNKRLSLNPSVGVKYYIGKSKHITSIGLIVPLISQTKEVTEWQTNETPEGKEQRNIKYAFSPGLFINHSAELINRNGISVSLNAQFGIMSLTRKSKSLNNYWDKDGKNANDVFQTVSERELNYINPNDLDQGQKLNDPAFNPLGFDSSKAREAFSYTENMSYYGLGIQFAYKLFPTP